MRLKRSLNINSHATGYMLVGHAHRAAISVFLLLLLLILIRLACEVVGKSFHVFIFFSQGQPQAIAKDDNKSRVEHRVVCRELSFELSWGCGGSCGNVSCCCCCQQPGACMAQSNVNKTHERGRGRGGCKVRSKTLGYAHMHTPRFCCWPVLRLGPVHHYAGHVFSPLGQLEELPKSWHLAYQSTL